MPSHRKKQPEPHDNPPPPVPGAVSPVEAIEVLGWTDQSNGDCTATVGPSPGLTREDGSAPASDDVLAVTREGQLQTRAAGSNGSFERCTKVQQGLLAYQPDGPGHRVFLVPYVETAKLPNR